MKSICLFIISLPFIGGFNTHQVTDILDPKPKISQNYTKYFNYVNLSNRQLYFGNIESASLYLDTAFLQVRIPFFIDIKRKMLINWKLKRHSENIKLLNFLVEQKHFNLEQIKLEISKEIVEFYNFKAIPKNLSTQNLALKNQLALLFKEEQDRLEYPELQKDGKNDEETKSDYITKKKRKEFFQLFQAKQFVDLINQYGFPDENQIGYYVENKQVGDEDKYISLPHILDILLIDFMNTKYRNELCMMLNNALAEHKIHPAIYAKIMDSSYGREYTSKYDSLYIQPAVISVQDIYYKPFIEYNKDLIASINSNRIRIGLDSLHTEQYQMACMKICADSFPGRLIQIPAYSFIDIYGLGVVMYGFENDKEKLSTYRIDMAKVRSQCNCAAFLIEK